MENEDNVCRAPISDADILEAMKKIPGYIDITPADFQIVYQAAFETASRRLRQSLRVGDIMTREVISIEPTASIATAARLLSGRKFSGAPVVDETRQVVGVISEKDFPVIMGLAPGDSFMAVVATCLGGKACPAIPARKQTVAELMSAPAVTCTADATVYELSALMTRKSINRVPVVDEEMRITGIVTRSAVVSAFCAIDR